MGVRRTAMDVVSRWILLDILLTSTYLAAAQQKYPVPGFLNYENLPQTQFSCEGKVIGGYYADVETGCQMFHVCTLGQKGEVRDMKFLCLNGTVFAQETRVCERIDEVNCAESERFFRLNLELYHPPSTTDYDYYYYDDYEQQRNQHEQQLEDPHHGIRGRSLQGFGSPSDAGSAAETIEHPTFTSQLSGPDEADQSRPDPRSEDSTSASSRSSSRANPFIITKDQLPKEEPESQVDPESQTTSPDRVEYSDYEDTNPPTAEAQEEIQRVENADFDVPRIPFSKANDTWITVTNGKPFLPRLKRDLVIGAIKKILMLEDKEEQGLKSTRARRMRRDLADTQEDSQIRNRQTRQSENLDLVDNADQTEETELIEDDNKEADEPEAKRKRSRRRRRRRRKKLTTVEPVEEDQGSPDEQKPSLRSTRGRKLRVEEEPQTEETLTNDVTAKPARGRLVRPIASISQDVPSGPKAASFVIEDEEPTTERSRFVPRFRPRGRSSGLTAPDHAGSSFRRENSNTVRLTPEEREYSVRPTLEAAVLATSSELPVIIQDPQELEAELETNEKVNQSELPQQKVLATNDLDLLGNQEQQPFANNLLVDDSRTKQSSTPKQNGNQPSSTSPKSEINADESSQGGSLSVSEILRRNTPQQRKFLEAANKSKNKDERVENILKALGVKPIQKTTFKSSRSSRTDLFRKLKVPDSTTKPTLQPFVQTNVQEDVAEEKFPSANSGSKRIQDDQPPDVKITPVAENKEESLIQPPRRRKKVLVSKKKKLVGSARTGRKLDEPIPRNVQETAAPVSTERVTTARTTPQFSRKRKLLPSFANLPRARSRQAVTSEAPWEVTDPPPSSSTSPSTPTTRRTTTTTTTTTPEPVIIESVPYLEEPSTKPTPRVGRNRQEVKITTETATSTSTTSATTSKPVRVTIPSKQLQFDDYDYDDLLLGKNAKKELRRRKFSENFLKVLKTRKASGVRAKSSQVPRTTTTGPIVRSRGRRPAQQQLPLGDLLVSTLEPAVFVDQNEIVTDVPPSSISAQFSPQNELDVQPVFPAFEETTTTSTQATRSTFPASRPTTTTTRPTFQPFRQTTTTLAATTTTPQSAARSTSQTFKATTTAQIPAWRQTFQSFRPTTETNEIVEAPVAVPQRGQKSISIDDLDAEVISKARQDSQHARHQLRQKQVQQQLINLQRETQNLQLILQQKQHQSLLLAEPLRDRFGGRDENDVLTTTRRSVESQQRDALDAADFQNIFNAASDEHFGRKSNPKRSNSFVQDLEDENLIDAPEPGQPEMPRNIQQIRDQERHMKPFGANVQPPPFKPPQQARVTVQPPASMFEDQQQQNNPSIEATNNNRGSSRGGTNNRNNPWAWPGTGPAVQQQNDEQQGNQIPQTIAEAQKFTQNAKNNNLIRLGAMPQLPNFAFPTIRVQGNADEVQTESPEVLAVPWIFETVNNVDDEANGGIQEAADPTTQPQLDENSFRQTTEAPAAPPVGPASVNLQNGARQQQKAKGNKPRKAVGSPALLSGNFSPILISRKTFVRKTPSPAIVPPTATPIQQFSQPANLQQPPQKQFLNNQQRFGANQQQQGFQQVQQPQQQSQRTNQGFQPVQPVQQQGFQQVQQPQQQSNQGFQQQVLPQSQQRSPQQNNEGFQQVDQDQRSQQQQQQDDQEFQLVTPIQQRGFQQAQRPQQQFNQQSNQGFQQVQSQQRPSQQNNQGFQQVQQTQQQNDQGFQQVQQPQQQGSRQGNQPQAAKQLSANGQQGLQRQVQQQGILPAQQPQQNPQQRNQAFLQQNNQVPRQFQPAAITQRSLLNNQQQNIATPSTTPRSATATASRPGFSAWDNFKRVTKQQNNIANFQQTRPTNAPPAVNSNPIPPAKSAFGPSSNNALPGSQQKFTAGQKSPEEFSSRQGKNTEFDRFTQTTTVSSLDNNQERDNFNGNQLFREQEITTATAPTTTRKTTWPNNNAWWQNRGSSFNLQSLWSTTSQPPLSVVNNNNNNNNVGSNQQPPVRVTTQSSLPRTIGQGSLIQKIPPSPTTPRTQRSLSNQIATTNQNRNQETPQARKVADVNDDDFPFTADVIGPVNRAQSFDKVAYPTYDFSNLPDTSFSCIGKTPGKYYADLEAQCQMYHICSQSRAKGRIIDYRFLCTNGTVFNELISACDTYERVDCGGGLSIYSLLDDIYRPSHVPTEVELLEVGIGTAIGQKRLADASGINF